MDKPCARCGATMDVKPSHYELVVYCSKACMASAYSERMAGDNNPHYSNASERTCERCGKLYHSYNKARKYCSHGCYVATGTPQANGRKNQGGYGAPHYCVECGAPVAPGTKRCAVCRPMAKRSFGKKDANQGEIVAALEAAGCQVLDLSGLGCGCPDILVDYHETLYLMEIKNPATRGKLNKLQIEWHAKWQGRKPIVVYTAESALRAIGAMG